MVRPLTEEIFTETIMPIFRSEGGSFDIQRILTSRDSVPIDKYSIYGNLRETTRIHKYFRLAYKLGIRGMTTHMARFAAEFDKFRTRRNAHYYNISGRPFSTSSIRVIDPPRYFKVERFLRRHLTREPTNKDVDLVVYTYFGSDAFSTTDDLYNGLQDSYYNARGSRIFSGAPRRRQSRIRSYRNMYNNSTYRYHGYVNISNTNTNNNNNSSLFRQGGISLYNNGLGSNSNSNSNSNNRHTAVEYFQNKTAVKRNQNRNKSNNAKKIQWTENTVNNMPEDFIAGHNFSNGQKAVKYTWREGGKNFSRYMEPNTFRTQSRMSMTGAYNKPGSFSMFKNPFVRRDVKRSNINFVILKKRVVQKSVLKKKTEKQATAKKARAVRTEKLRVKRKR